MGVLASTCILCCRSIVAGSLHDGSGRSLLVLGAWVSSSAGGQYNLGCSVGFPTVGQSVKAHFYHRSTARESSFK